jgi:hypothetical protein
VMSFLRALTVLGLPSPWQFQEIIFMALGWPAEQSLPLYCPLVYFQSWGHSLTPFFVFLLVWFALSLFLHYGLSLHLLTYSWCHWIELFCPKWY